MSDIQSLIESAALIGAIFAFIGGVIFPAIIVILWKAGRDPPDVLFAFSPMCVYIMIYGRLVRTFDKKIEEGRFK